ncbi:MAG TPA: APC family permease [Methanocella sp.]|nr:APC family permease [Methanocella sp.]
MAEVVKNRVDRPLGIADLVGLGVGGTIGSGIFVVPAVAAGMSGAGSLLTWILCAISFGAVLACLTLLSRKYAVTGAFYTIFDRSFGERISALVIMAYIISGILGVATIAAAIGESVVIPGVSSKVLETFLVIGFGAINLMGIALSAWIEDVLTVLKILPLLIIPLILLPFVQTGNFTFEGGNSLSFLSSAVVVYWCFTGFELSAIPSRAVRDPERSVPRSLIYVFATVALIYLSLNFALIGSVGAKDLASTSAPISYAVDRFFPGTGIIIAAVAVVSMISALNAYLLGTSIVVQSFSGKYNKDFAFEHRGVPVYALILCTALTAFLLLFTDYFVFLASASVITTLIPYLCLCYAALKSIDRPLVKIIAVAGLVSTIAILISSVL